MPESMWVMRVKKFGPLICSIDTQGRNLFKENKKVFEERKAPIVERIVSHQDGRHLASLAEGKEGVLADFSISPEQLG